VVTATDPAGNLRTNTYQVSGAGSTRTFTHDNNGNLASKVEGGVTTTYEWDAENRLTAINQGALRSEFIYDGDGKRTQLVEKSNSVVTADRRFVFDGIVPTEERDAANAVVKRFFASGYHQGGATFYWVEDHLGSVRDVTDSSGTLRARYDYDPFGRRAKISGDIDADFGFTGQYAHTLSGLQLAIHRAYNAELGRWLSEDPLSRPERSIWKIAAEGDAIDEIAGGQLPPDGPNLFAYVGGNPVAWTDYEGEARRRCPPRVYLILRAAVLATCKTPTGCSPADSCNVLKLKIVTKRLCIAAQTALTKACFPNDPTHQQRCDDERRGIKKCEDIMKKKGCK
jgi:RHS repeat-associated protein